MGDSKDGGPRADYRGNYAGCNPQTLGEEKDREIARLRSVLEKIQELSNQFDDGDGDAYDDIDALQVFENGVSDLVELALAARSSGGE